MNCLQSWPEPIVPVQSLSDSGIRVIPDRYIKRAAVRNLSSLDFPDIMNIPVIDLSNLGSNDPSLRISTLNLISNACRDWGFFQVVNHGIDHRLMARTREIWREFFHMPVEDKLAYANSPTTYEGYGSRLGVEKGAKLDWSDYFFLHYLPTALRDEKKWPSLPVSCRELVGEYNEELVKLCEKLMKILSINLGLEEGYFQKAFGGDMVGASLRVNYYPKCPQPDLALGLSPHSDIGCLTILLPDDHVSGLQVRRGDNWITVNPIPNAFIVNIGDQIQIISNAKYKSVEHQVVVNSAAERVSLAFFYNPRGDILIQPAMELVTEDEPAEYDQPMTFNKYRAAIRTKGPSGKSSLESLKSPRLLTRSI